MRVRFPALPVILLLSLGFLSGCGSSEATHSTAAPSTAAKAAAEPDAETVDPDPFPEDDGYACAIFFGAEIVGSLDDCGCPKHPEGGLYWRMGYSNEFIKRSPGVATLQVDAGYFFSDFHDNNGQLFPVAEKRNEWVLKGYSQMNFAVANLSSHDLPYAERLFQKAAYEKQQETTPMLTRLISANVRAGQPGYVSPPPYVIREVSGERLPTGRKLRVGFVGLTDVAEGKPIPSVFEMKDPLAAARRVIPQVRPRCDVLVVLAYLPSDKAEQLARQVSGIDLIVNANNMHNEQEPVRINRTTLAYARYQTRSLGEALLYVNQEGRLTHIRTRMVEMDDTVPSDATTKELVDQAKAEIVVEEQKLFQQLRQKAKPQGPQPVTPVPWQ